MIITKKTAMRNNTRSARGHIIAAVDYIYRDEPPGRVGDVWTSPEMADIGTGKNAIKGMMLGTAELNERARNPIRHYVITWREGEELTPEMVHQMLTAAGVQEHQWVFVKHHDHDAEGHQHGHLLVNSIHPQTFKSNNFFNDIKIMMQEVAKIAHTRGWDRTDAPEYQNARYRVREDGKIEDQREVRDQAIPKERARAAERHGEIANMETYLNTIREELFPTKDSIKNIGTWQDFHAALAQHGLKYTQKGSGAIWEWTHEGQNGEPQTETRKASVIPSFSLSKMEKLFGRYEPPQRPGTSITGRIASPTNPETKEKAERDLSRVRREAAETRRGIQKRQTVRSVLEYTHSQKFHKMHTQGKIAQAQTRAMEARQKAAERRAQEEAARARAELLQRQAEAAEMERQKKARQAEEEARKREQERIQKEAEEARQREIERQHREAEESRIREEDREEEKQRDKETPKRKEPEETSEATQKSMDTSRLQMSRRRFVSTYQRHAVEGADAAIYHAVVTTWEMDWKSTEEAQEYTARWITELGFPDTPQGRQYIAYYGAGGPVHMEALQRAQEVRTEQEMEAEGPTR